MGLLRGQRRFRARHRDLHIRDAVHRMVDLVAAVSPAKHATLPAVP